MDKKYEIAHLIGITREHEEQFRNAEKILTRNCIYSCLLQYGRILIIWKISKYVRRYVL